MRETELISSLISWRCTDGNLQLWITPTDKLLHDKFRIDNLSTNAENDNRFALWHFWWTKVVFNLLNTLHYLWLAYLKKKKKKCVFQHLMFLMWSCSSRKCPLQWINSLLNKQWGSFLENAAVPSITGVDMSLLVRGHLNTPSVSHQDPCINPCEIIVNVATIFQKEVSEKNSWTHTNS